MSKKRRTASIQRRTSPSRSSPARLEQLLANAVRLHRAGKLKSAQKHYERVLEAVPDHLSALSGVGMIAHAQGRHLRAVALLERVVAAAENHPGYRMNLAAVYDAAGDEARAEEHYRRAIATAPQYPDPYYNLGALKLRQDRPDAAIEIFDACLAARGRDFHALAYKAHALRDAERHDEAHRLLDHRGYVRRYGFRTPEGFADLDAFNRALADHVASHPSLRANVMSTVKGRHTAELLTQPRGPMGAMEIRIHEAVRRYLRDLPDDPRHPVVAWRPRAWKLTTWGVVMSDRGHERPHIHPNGWISGVFYVELPDLVNDAARHPEGWLQFGRPTPELPVKTPPELCQYQPRYGDIVLFPSYFYHGTVPFSGDTRRICVSFDVEPR